MRTISDRIAAAYPAAWTRWYWPAALAVSIGLYIAAPPAWSNRAIAAGTVLLGVPELACLARRRWRDTFSDWVWQAIDVARSQPIWDWSAVHFLAFGGYLVLAFSVDRRLWHDGYWLGGLGLVLAVWLTWHLFGRWWR